ncbi:hypothetical protein HZ326_13014 [Fusarium oxysporum f. sp. albedinis]|nr:hypothetical protein HZ326_13014 [Fusarium oxysporum f. sp. albedinis]
MTSQSGRRLSSSISSAIVGIALSQVSAKLETRRSWLVAACRVNLAARKPHPAHDRSSLALPDTHSHSLPRPESSVH